MNQSPTLALCMIVRDVAPFIQRCLGTIVNEIDELCVVDTGSTDDTIAMIEDVVRMRNIDRELPFRLGHYNPQTHPKSFILDVPETFVDMTDPPPPETHSGKLLLANYGEARQMSFDLAESDYIMWIDSDDIMPQADEIRDIVNELGAGNYDTALMNYNYEQDDIGRSVCQLLRARIVKNVKKGGIAKWQQPIHETLAPFGNYKLYTGIEVTHQARWNEKDQVHRVPLRNYKVLIHHLHQQQKAGEEPHPRTYFYLGNESRPFSNDRALKYFREYVKRSDWAEEKGLALVYSGQIHEAEGDLAQAEAHYASGIATFAAKPEGHFGLARIAYYRQDWQSVKIHHERGRIEMAKQRDVLHYNPLDRTFFPAISASAAYLQLDGPGDLIKARRIADEGLKASPTNLALKGALEVAERRIAQIKRRLRIQIHTSGSLEPWGPDSPHETGVGGSETAAVHMARCLADLGHDVEVYCECDGFEKRYSENLVYHHWSKYKPGDASADVFISSRRPSTLLEVNTKARIRGLWLHDNHVGPPSVKTCEGLLAADFIMTVSRWHRSYVLEKYPFLDARRVIATRNGIDDRLFVDDQVVAKQNKLIYSSSADRGLAIALDLFPYVRKEVPDAELHIFYGFDTMKQMIAAGFFDETASSELLAQIEATKAKAESIEGVHLRGRIGQRQLVKEMHEAKVLFYPTIFEESSCITAMEAQAAACIPVTTFLAALPETVHHGSLIRPPATDPTYQKAFVERTVDILKNWRRWMRFALDGREHSLPFHSWRNVAEEWEMDFCLMLAKGPVASRS